jgi:hypothetical protein
MLETGSEACRAQRRRGLLAALHVTRIIDHFRGHDLALGAHLGLDLDVAHFDLRGRPLRVAVPALGTHDVQQHGRAEQRFDVGLARGQFADPACGLHALEVVRQRALGLPA